ncbi:hypothetical protein CMT57_06230 [Elizabethkingia anophelis]|uniref:hypothetical protein n=1 Tax=Elizabethkingia anophelis TaxID=1117645 RepID=UPI0020138847|nr:hypothetical protein [Elizabethkingia anophelis]MCL1689438.1 hypothetical protein [Elizabethkingia anophelis]MDV4009431.1 hypothetical protein [Elizabethkingia anophelis]
MNQTKDIINFFEHVIKDNRLCPSHISIYVALFQCWSKSGFQNPFRICRSEVMKLGKIKSFGTYHRCIKELHLAGFIVYSPSYDAYKGSLVEIIDFEQSETFIDTGFQELELSVQKENHFSVPKFFEVELYFNERNQSSAQAHQFYSFYDSQNWKLSGGKLMNSWQAAARNWIVKEGRIGS